MCHVRNVFVKLRLKHRAKQGASYLLCTSPGVCSLHVCGLDQVRFSRMCLPVPKQQIIDSIFNLMKMAESSIEG